MIINKPGAGTLYLSKLQKKRDIAIPLSFSLLHPKLCQIIFWQCVNTFYWPGTVFPFFNVMTITPFLALSP